MTYLSLTDIFTKEEKQGIAVEVIFLPTVKINVYTDIYIKKKDIFFVYKKIKGIWTFCQTGRLSHVVLGTSGSLQQVMAALMSSSLLGGRQLHHGGVDSGNGERSEKAGL